MKTGKKALLWMLALTLCGEATLVHAVSADNPYQAITERNVFGLRPPAPPAPDPSSIKPPPPKVTLTGIITMFGRKRALLKMTPPPPKGEQPKEQSYILEEGQRDGELEVVSIDENAGSVTLNNYGTVTTITFEAPKAPPAPAPGAPVPAPGGGMAAPAAPPPAFGNPGGGLRSLPTRTLRLPGMPGSTPGAGAGLNPGGAGAAPAYGGGGAAYTAPGSAQQQTQQQAQPSYEESVAMIEAKSLKYQKEGNPLASILPRTPLSQQLNQETSAAEPQPQQQTQTTTTGFQAPPGPFAPRFRTRPSGF